MLNDVKRLPEILREGQRWAVAVVQVALEPKGHMKTNLERYGHTFN